MSGLKGLGTISLCHGRQETSFIYTICIHLPTFILSKNKSPTSIAHLEQPPKLSHHKHAWIRLSKNPTLCPSLQGALVPLALSQSPIKQCLGRVSHAYRWPPKCCKEYLPLATSVSFPNRCAPPKKQYTTTRFFLRSSVLPLQKTTSCKKSLNSKMVYILGQNPHPKKTRITL